MKVNKDLMESLMMLAGITLVLVGTTHFESAQTKWMVMGGVGFLLALTGVLRYGVAPRQERSDEQPHAQS